MIIVKLLRQILIIYNFSIIEVFVIKKYITIEMQLKILQKKLIYQIVHHLTLSEDIVMIQWEIIS